MVSWLRQSMNQRVASTPMSSSSSSRPTKSPLRFDICARSPLSTMWTRRMINASKRSGSAPSPAIAARRRRDVAVVIGAEHVDQAVEAALELVPVIGDVGGQVGRFAVGADQHAILVVAEGCRAQPERLFAAVGVAAAVELCQGRVDLATAVEVALGEPVVEAHAEAIECAAHLLRGSARPRARRSPRGRRGRCPRRRPARRARST